jgi:hypothetical protein
MNRIEFSCIEFTEYRLSASSVCSRVRVSSRGEEELSAQSHAAPEHSMPVLLRAALRFVRAITVRETFKQLYLVRLYFLFFHARLPL